MFRCLKATLALFLGALALTARADLVILQYHHVSDSTPPSTSTTVSLFEDQLAMIERLELDVEPLESATRRALDGELQQKPTVAITFDDAMSSVYTTAAPKLAEKGYPYTVFVNTDAVGGNGYMTWKQLAELNEREGVTLANHSHNHQHLVRKPGESEQGWRARMEVSLDTAQDILDDKLGSAPPLFAYPYGEFSTELERLLKERDWYGYGQQSGAVGAQSGATRLPRFPMADAYGQLDTLKTKLTSRGMPIDGNALPDGIIEENPPTLTFTLPENMDSNRLSCFASGQGGIDVSATANNRVSVMAPSAFNSRRFRYNCTYPAGNGAYYWLSQQWLDLSQPED